MGIWEYGIMEPVLGRLKSDFIDGALVCVEQYLEGQGLDRSGNYQLGCKAGPLICVTNLMHEMGHLAEMEVDRIVARPSRGWGLGRGTPVDIDGHRYWQMNTDKGVMREARAWAYQLSLQRHYGIERSAKDTISSVVYMDDGWWAHKRRIGETSDSKALELFAARVDEMSHGEFTMEAFRKNWRVRMEALARVPFRGR